MKIIGGMVYLDGKFERAEILTEGEEIQRVTVIGEGVTASGENVRTEAQEDIDASGCYIIPGLVDIHFHGCMGRDFCDGEPEALRAMAAYQQSRGVTSICPASMTYDEEKLSGIFQAAAAFAGENPKGDAGAVLRGINMEGPFISKEKKAAQNEVYICKPDAEMFRRLQEKAEGLIRLVDVAPETEGAMEFIRQLSGQVHISLAHSGADYDTAVEAFAAGADHVTHLFNAMNPFLHRAPGIVGATFDNPKVYAELIGDNLHIAPAVVRMVLKLMGERTVLISDSMRACGMPDGMYELGGQPVEKIGRRAQLKDGTLAGSASDLMDCMVRLVKEMGVSLETAVRCTTVNPAESIGISDRVGSIEAGKMADLVLLDKDLNIKGVIAGGILR